MNDAMLGHRVTSWGRVVAAAGIALLGCSSPATVPDTQEPDATAAPVFRVDPSWPRIPDGWTLGVVSGIAVDEQDHVWILHRPRTVEPARRGRAAPAVLEFDAEGNFVQGWGGAGEGYEWPASEHGIFVDHAGYVWITGNGRDEPGFLDDHHVLKFTRGGSFVLQIGRAGRGRDNADRENLRAPADAFVHRDTNELFVADGYVNRRVVVFDADTGAFKRTWGAFGQTPADALPPVEDPERGASQFDNVHSARVSHDGLVYVCDRGGRRLQVFTLSGEYRTQVFIDRWCQAPECDNGYTAASTAFSPDPEQRFLYVASRSPGRILVLDRKSLRVLTSFGTLGRAAGEFQVIHHMATDSRGNIYTTEVEPGNRAQKFVLAPAAARPAQGQVLAPTGTLRVAFIEDNPVQGRVAPGTGLVTGPAADLTRELARRLGVPFTITPAASAEAVIDSVRRQQADIGFVAYNDERARIVDFSQPYLVSASAYLVRADSGITSSAGVDRDGIRVGAVRGQSQQLYISAQMRRARVEILPDAPPPDAIAALLLEKKLDAFGANRQRMEEAAATSPLLRVLADDFMTTAQAIVVDKGRTRQIADIDAVLTELKRSGFVQASLDKADIAGVAVAPEERR